MAISIHIPTPLRPFCDQQDVVSIERAGTVQSVFNDLTDTYTGLKKHLYDDKGDLRKFVNIYLNEEDIRYQDGPSSAVKDGDVISIVPSIAGG